MVENEWRIHFFAETAHWSDNTFLLQRQSPSGKLINNVFHLPKIIYVQLFKQFGLRDINNVLLLAQNKFDAEEGQN